MNSTEITFNAKPEFTIETLSQLAFFNGFAIYRSSYRQTSGAILICGEPDKSMMQKIIKDPSVYHIIIPNEDKAKETKLQLKLLQKQNTFVYDCIADELPFNPVSLQMAFVKPDTSGLNSQFYSEMFRCLNF